jgi:hypothetical protein
MIRGAAAASSKLLDGPLALSGEADPGSVAETAKKHKLSEQTTTGSL